MAHALDIPEIRDTIIQFLILSRNDLLACTLLSHPWHSSVQPWLWRHLYLYSALQPTRLPQKKAPFPAANLQNPPCALFQQNAVFIRHLHIKAPIDSLLLATLNSDCNASSNGGDMASLFPALETLHIHGYCCDVAVIDPEIHFATRLIRHALGQTTTLKELHLTSLPPSSVVSLLHALDEHPFASSSSPSTATRSSLTKHPLDRLCLTDLTLPYNLVDRTQFWQHCTSIRRLEFDTVNFLGYTCPAEFTFSRLEHLKLTNMFLLAAYEQLQLMSHCPNLTSLDWSPSSITTVHHILTTPPIISPAESSNHIIAPIDLSPLSKVHTLVLCGSRINDLSIANVLSKCGPLRKLNVHKSGFSHESIVVLATRHFPNLREIDLGECSFVTSPMVEMLLRQCPLLEVLVAPTLKVSDIMANNITLVEEAGEETGCHDIGGHKKEWVCSNLRVLEVQIEIDATRIDLERPFINARLATMQKLISIGIPRPHS
jgi:hypothetical protein